MQECGRRGQGISGVWVRRNKGIAVVCVGRGQRITWVSWYAGEVRRFWGEGGGGEFRDGEGRELQGWGEVRDCRSECGGGRGQWIINVGVRGGQQYCRGR